MLKIKSYWNEDKLAIFQERYHATIFKLSDQLRMLSGPKIIRWIDDFVEKKIQPLPQSTSTFELKVIESSEELKNKIVSLNKEFGLSRILSTFDYLHKKDGGQYFVDATGINLPWNITDSRSTWAERSNTINEVGSIYTAQGFDFNYVGLVLGPSVDYDPQTEQLVINIDKYKDTGAFAGREDMMPEEIRSAKETIILNSINVLMKRAIKGLYIYAVNPRLREKLVQLQKERELI